jgi:hypothetical protein
MSPECRLLGVRANPQFWVRVPSPGRSKELTSRALKRSVRKPRLLKLTGEARPCRVQVFPKANEPNDSPVRGSFENLTTARSRYRVAVLQHCSTEQQYFDPGILLGQLTRSTQEIQSNHHDIPSAIVSMDHFNAGSVEQRSG